MEHVLGPAVDAAGHRAKHVLQGQGDASPVVRLELRHGHGELRIRDGRREPELAKGGEVAAQLNPPDRRRVEVHETHIDVAEEVEQPTSAGDELRVTAMAGTLANDDLASTRGAYCRCCRGHQARIGVDHRCRVVLDDVGLEEHRLAADVDA
jgi:hypothetical protein